MPTVYRCSDCCLGFETGWYHYHQELNNAMAATFLACRKCGSWYRLDHKHDGSRDQLYSWGGQISWVPAESERWYHPAPGTPDETPIPFEHDFRPIRDEECSGRL